MCILDAIGNTPLVELQNLRGKPKAVRILAKLEGSNPGGSVKDRPARAMLAAAEADGTLTHAQAILEATSGNTGIALAMIGAARGYRVTLCMSAGVSQERRAVLEALGARVVLTNAQEGTDGAIRCAREMAQRRPDQFFMPDQYSNPHNVLSHYHTTGPEILAQTRGELDVFVAGMGTGGTLMGTGQYLKEQLPHVRVIGVEPPVGHHIQGLKNMCEAIRPRIYDPDRLDEKLTIVDQEAFQVARSLASDQGLFVGLSSGAAVAGALHIARRLARGTIVALLPDRGDRYLSTGVFSSATVRVA